MRTVIILLVLAVAGKVGLNEWIYRAATEDALIAAYSARAADICRNDARSRGFPAAQPMTRPGDIRLMVGASEHDVWLWDLGNASWAKRYRTPYLRLPLQTAEATLQCSFDIVKQTAVVTR